MSAERRNTIILYFVDKSKTAVPPMAKISRADRSSLAAVSI